MNRVDPVNISYITAPDEYSGEAGLLLTRVAGTESEASMLALVNSIFTQMFWSELVEKQQAKYVTIAREVWELWQGYKDRL